MLQEAKRQGLNTVITNFSGSTDGVSSTSGASNYLLGHKVGEKAAELLPRGAKVCVALSSPADTGSDDRWRGDQDALKEAGRDVGTMQFFGIDGLGDACISIEAGELTASVLQDAMDMGSNAIRIALGMIDGDIVTEKYLIKPIVITGDNVGDVIAIHKANGAL